MPVEIMAKAKNNSGHKTKSQRRSVRADRKTQIVPADVVEEHLAKAVMQKQGAITLSVMVPIELKGSLVACDAILDAMTKGVGAADPLEGMLIEQLAWCHQRVLNLSLLSVKATPLSHRLAGNEQCDKAMNAYRRGMLALAEYRAAKKRGHVAAAPDEITSSDEPPARDVNGRAKKKNTTNELGANHGNGPPDRSQPSKPSKVARAHARRNGAATRRGTVEPAVAGIDWSAHRLREGPLQEKRP